MELDRLVADFAVCLAEIDASGTRFKDFQAGVGPYGEPQLVKLVAEKLNQQDPYRGLVATKRTPDLLIKGHWAVEVKIARPFGDNGREAENWSVNLLHPYKGNVSVVGDCFKLLDYTRSGPTDSTGNGYEHAPPQIDLSVLIASFEAIAGHVCRFRLGERVETAISGLAHPVHQRVRVFAWEVVGADNSN